MMPHPDLLAKESHRLSGHAQCPQAKVPTYQELLDEALDDTFPASDPIASSAAMHVHEPYTTARDTKDWTLKPGACLPVGQPCEDDGEGKKVSDSVAAFVTESFQCEVKGQGLIFIPAGPCTVKQTLEKATLYWEENMVQRSNSLPLEDFHQLLAEGKVKRRDPI